MVIPKHLQIETVNGVCSARCTICTIENWTRTPNTMSLETFRLILGKFDKYKDQIDYLTLHFCGEPLLDKGLADKIRAAKEMGFRGTGFATNGTHLNKETSRDLIEAGLDTIICSIDGLTRETHEAIRVGTDFEEVRSNVERFIGIRNELGGPTRVLVRFIYQDSNKHEWPEFKEYWSERLDPEMRDDVIRFFLHNWGENLEKFDEMASRHDIDTSKLICEDLFERLVIYSNGDVGLCCADDNGFFQLGNVLETDPIELYNSELFTQYREMMKEGRISELDVCMNCSLPFSRALKKDD